MSALLPAEVTPLPTIEELAAQAKREGKILFLDEMAVFNVFNQYGFSGKR